MFFDGEEKHRAILEEVVAIHETARPVLLITRTAEIAEQVSMELFQMNIPNNLLIAQNVAKEAQMIAEAGQLSAVTVATSMAGRGTDIKLATGVHELGGLAVIISEHMENSRIDKQLRGRSGRQGDPGTSQIYISLDDYLVQRWGEDKLSNNKRLQGMDRVRLTDSRVFKHKVQRIVTKAQRVSEEQGMTMREMSNEYEKSISIQRDLVYQERDKVLNMQCVEDFNLNQLAYDVFQNDVLLLQGRITQEKLTEYIYNNISFKFEGDVSQLNFSQHETVIEYLLAEFHKQLKENKLQLKNDYFYIRFVQKSMLKAIDSTWINQVDNLQQLKASVNNRQNGQRNAIFEYHKVALESFEQMNYKIKGNIIKNLCQSIITYDEEGDLVIHFP